MELNKIRHTVNFSVIPVPTF